MISAEVLLPKGEVPQLAKVLCQSVDKNGKVIGNHNKNLLFNTLVYDVDFPDGSVKKYAANVIVENLLAQCDPDEPYTNVMEVILDHKSDEKAVPMSEKYFTIKQGRSNMRQSTMGWSFQIKRNNGSTEWVALKYLKETNPVDAYKYANARGIEKNPDFAWWIPYTLHKRDVITLAVSSRVQKCSQKYEIEIPTSIAHAKNA